MVLKSSQSNAPAISYQDLLAQCTRPVAEILQSIPRELGTQPLPASNYTSAVRCRNFHRIIDVYMAR